MSDDHRAALDRIICLPEADDARFHMVGWAYVHEDHVVVLVMDESIEQLHELCMTARGKSALEDGQLQPLAEAFHEAEYATPPSRIGNVVRDDI